jgi:hypothetical protein
MGVMEVMEVMRVRRSLTIARICMLRHKRLCIKMGDVDETLDASESEDDFIVVQTARTKSEKKDTPKHTRTLTPNRKRSSGAGKRKSRVPKSSLNPTNAMDESGTLPVITNHCDPSNAEVVEWMLEDKWSNLKQYHVDKDSHLEKLLEACTLIQSQPECTARILELTHVVTRNAMALTDRFTLECELMRQTVNDELIDTRRNLVSFLDAYRQEETKTQSTQSVTNDALMSVLKVSSALRGIYPDVSLAHPHPTPTLPILPTLSTVASSSQVK